MFFIRSMMTHKIINITSPEKHKDIQTELTYRNNWHFIPPIRKISDEDIPTGLSVDYRYLLSPRTHTHTHTKKKKSQ